jgi:hypothetical protein
MANLAILSSAKYLVATERVLSDNGETLRLRPQNDEILIS